MVCQWFVLEHFRTSDCRLTASNDRTNDEWRAGKDVEAVMV